VSEPVAAACPPPDGFHGCISVSVVIRATSHELYRLVTDIENLSAFWPDYEFQRADAETLEPGSLYYSRKKGNGRWVPYRIAILEPNQRMVGEVTEADNLFARLRYDHRLTAVDGDTLSHEKLAYSVRYGFLGRIADRLFVRRIIKKQVLDAHLRLKQIAEKDKPKRGQEYSRKTDSKPEIQN